MESKDYATLILIRDMLDICYNSLMVAIPTFPAEPNNKARLLGIKQLESTRNNLNKAIINLNRGINNL